KFFFIYNCVYKKYGLICLPIGITSTYINFITFTTYYFAIYGDIHLTQRSNLDQHTRTRLTKTHLLQYLPISLPLTFDVFFVVLHFSIDTTRASQPRPTLKGTGQIHFGQVDWQSNCNNLYMGLTHCHKQEACIDKHLNYHLIAIFWHYCQQPLSIFTIVISVWMAS
ncbi:hypothetical protein ACJX0J_040546, partial [Zea mays]